MAKTTSGIIQAFILYASAYESTGDTQLPKKSVVTTKYVVVKAKLTSPQRRAGLTPSFTFNYNSLIVYAPRCLKRINNIKKVLYIQKKASIAVKKLKSIPNIPIVKMIFAAPATRDKRRANQENLISLRTNIACTVTPTDRARKNNKE